MAIGFESDSGSIPKHLSASQSVVHCLPHIYSLTETIKDVTRER